MTMRLRPLIALAIFSALTLPAAAEVKFYIYREPASGQCFVVKGSAMRMYGTPYDTREAAETALKADPSCK